MAILAPVDREELRSLYTRARKRVEKDSVSRIQLHISGHGCEDVSLIGIGIYVYVDMRFLLPLNRTVLNHRFGP